MRILLSDHAECRMQQRGAKPDHIAVVATMYDRKIHLNSGLTALSLSKDAVNKVRSVLGDAIASRCARLTLLVDFDKGVIVTVIKSDCAHRRAQSKHRRGGGRFIRRDVFWGS